MSILIADVDGTLTITGDTPNQPLIDAINRAVMSGQIEVIIVSARSIDRLEETRAWLQEHGVAGVREVHLNDFPGTPFATGLAFKEYKYGLIAEEYGEEAEYAIDNDAEVRAMALDKYEISAMSPAEAVMELSAQYPEEEERAPVAGKDKYSTQEEAADRAEQIGCEGTHSMNENGEKVYMPCSTHAAYDAIVNADKGPASYRAPAPPEDQIDGSDKNEPGSAKGKTGDITLTAATEKALQGKTDEHNAQMTEEDRPEWTRVRVGALRAVYRRGSGAFSSSHRPGIGRAQWSMARVNAFLRLARTGSPENPKYVTDNDLLSPGHPRYSEAERMVATDDPSSDAEKTPKTESRADLSVPDFMRQNAIRGLDLLQYKGDGLRPNTITEARELARGRASEDKWRRIRAWIARHISDLARVSAIVEGERPSAGQVAHLLWGSGDTTEKARRAYEYAERVVAAMDNEAQRTATEEQTPTPEAPTYDVVKGEVEVRALTGELRVDVEARTIIGYAALFNSESSPMPFIETLAPGAFTRSLGQVAASGKVVKLLHGHDESQMLAATPTSLSLTQDERGLQVTADIIKSPIGDHLIALAQRDPQAIAWSFGFRVMDDKWDGNKRTIHEAALHEVSLLSGHTPAYPGTIGLAAVRGLAKRRNLDAEGLWKAMHTWLRGDTVAESDASAIIAAFEGSVSVPAAVRARMLALKERIGE